MVNKEWDHCTFGILKTSLLIPNRAPGYLRHKGLCTESDRHGVYTLSRLFNLLVGSMDGVDRDHDQEYLDVEQVVLHGQARSV